MYKTGTTYLLPILPTLGTYMIMYLQLTCRYLSTNWQLHNYSSLSTSAYRYLRST